MGKTIKLTKTQIATLVNEEVKKLKKAKAIQEKMSHIASQLNEMYEAEELNKLSEGLGDKIKQVGQKVGNFFNSGLNPQQAEQTYNQSYARQYPEFQRMYKIDEATFKNAVLAYLQKYGMITPSSTIFDPNTKQFVKKTGVQGNSGGIGFSESTVTGKK